MVGNPQHAPVHLVLETLPETATSLLISGYSIKKLIPGIIHKADDHGAKRLSASLMTSS